MKSEKMLIIKRSLRIHLTQSRKYLKTLKRFATYTTISTNFGKPSWTMNKWSMISVLWTSKPSS